MTPLLLLVLTSAHAPAGLPAWVEPLPPKPTLCDRLLRCQRNFGMMISGAGCYYNRPGIPTSPGPTPTYEFYFRPIDPPMIVPTAPTPVDSAPKAK